ncbi:stabilizer of axonemal microtubules 4-like [Babylonia areolata]|uniref:stabilizer of axonemal microtubules 4-like n=1 Tax=Babylonia areolata TaxID=304850 RepID=UPI003FD69BEA
MGPLPTGPRTAHIQKSHGADTNIMKFYVTQNSTTYGKHWQNFKPRMGRHSGTGYSANFRPQVYYSTKLDELDNPTLGRICSANYHTITELSYQPYKEHNGKEPLPNSVHQVGTGFVRQKPITNPTEAEAKGVFIDTRVASAPASILPRGKPLLHKLQAKDPTELENQGYGPSYMKTETKQKFLGKQAPHDYDLNYMAVGPLTESGFTHSYNIEPVTYYPNNPHLGDKPGWFTSRPTGISITKTSYNPWLYPRGNEVNPGVTDPSERGSGFTRETAKPMYLNRVPGDAYDKADDITGPKLAHTRKNDPMEYLNMVHPNNHTSTNHDQYLGQQRPDLSHPDRLNRTKMGTQELSGYCENNDRFVKVADDQRRFITHYMTRFQDRNPYGEDRMGHTRGGIQFQQRDGYTMSTGVHSYGPDINNTQTLRNMEPYQARSIKARDQFYDDHKHDSKSQTLTAVA